jgi:hypothetical protein
LQLIYLALVGGFLIGVFFALFVLTFILFCWRRVAMTHEIEVGQATLVMREAEVVHATAAVAWEAEVA